MGLTLAKFVLNLWVKLGKYEKKGKAGIETMG